MNNSSELTFEGDTNFWTLLMCKFSALEKEIEEIHEIWMRRFAACDVRALSQLYTPDCRILAENVHLQQSRNGRGIEPASCMKRLWSFVTCTPIDVVDRGIFLLLSEVLNSHFRLFSVERHVPWVFSSQVAPRFIRACSTQESPVLTWVPWRWKTLEVVWCL